MPSRCKAAQPRNRVFGQDIDATAASRGARAIWLYECRQNSTEDGSADSGMKALTVAPALPIGPSVVTTVMFKATNRIAAMKASRSRSIQ